MLHSTETFYIDSIFMIIVFLVGYTFDMFESNIETVYDMYICISISTIQYQ